MGNNFNNIENNKPNHHQETSKDLKNIVDNKVLTNQKNSEHERLLEDFQKIYEEKKILWEKEDENKEKMKETNKKEKEEIINFMFSLERNKTKKNI